MFLNRVKVGEMKSLSFARMVTNLMVEGKLGIYKSDFTIIYGDFTEEYIEALKDTIIENVSKIPLCVTDSIGSYRNYFYVVREDGSTGCVKIYGRQRIKGVRWEDKRPTMAITAVKVGSSGYTDEEIFAGILPTLSPFNSAWVEVEIDNESK